MRSSVAMAPALVFALRKTGRKTETRLWTDSLPDVHWSWLLVLFAVVEMAESVPTQEFRASQGQKETVTMSGRSLYWPQSLGSYYTNDNNSGLRQDKRTVQPIQLCGHRLLEAMRGLCRGNYVAYSRRSDPDLHGTHIQTIFSIMNFETSVINFLLCLNF